MIFLGKESNCILTFCPNCNFAVCVSWTPQVTLVGSAYSIEERNGSKGPNLEYDDDDDDDVSLKLAFTYICASCTTKNNILPGLLKFATCKLLFAIIPLTGAIIL
jgi:hypothetical protein